MKYKIISGIVLSSIAAGVILAMQTKEPTVNFVPKKEEKTQQIIQTSAQESINNNPDNKVEDKLETKQIRSPEKLKELQGPLDKEYHIRRDILKYIDSTIYDEKAKHAAIVLSQVENFIYYESNKKEALEAMKKHMLAMYCLSKYSKNWGSIVDEIDKFMNNTNDRKEYIKYIDRNYFHGHILGTGLTSFEEDKACKEGKL